jgi:hypothetical protein
MDKSQFRQHFEVTHDGILVTHNTQDISAAADVMMAVRADDNFVKEGIKKDWLYIGHVPELLIHKWTKQGCDFDRMSAREICTKMRMEGYGNLLTSDRPLAR